MIIDRRKVDYVAEELGKVITLARAEGISETEIGAGLGLLIAAVAPADADKQALIDFAQRVLAHARSHQP